MTDFKTPPPPAGEFSAPTPESQPQVVEPNVEQPAVAPAVEPVQPEQMDRPAAAPVEESPTNTSGNQNPALNKFYEQKEKVMAKFNELPNNKKQVIILAGAFLIGLLMGAIMFGGDSEPAAPAPTGLQGVVSNPDIKEPLKRCGQVEASSPCVLYVMNNYTYEKLAEDFFETAVSVTRRKDQVIRMDNVRYTTMRIPPGYFAQIKIPAYK